MLCFARFGPRCGACVQMVAVCPDLGVAGPFRANPADSCQYQPAGAGGPHRYGGGASNVQGPLWGLVHFGPRAPGPGLPRPCAHRHLSPIGICTHRQCAHRHMSPIGIATHRQLSPNGISRQSTASSITPSSITLRTSLATTTTHAHHLFIHHHSFICSTCCSGCGRKMPLQEATCRRHGRGGRRAAFCTAE